MPKLITFNVPTATMIKRKGKQVPDATTYKVDQRQGFIALLKAGDHTVKCVMQLDAYGKPSILAHYASGYRLADLASRALTRYVSNPYAWNDTLADYRGLAQETIDEYIRAMGMDKLFERFASVPVINK